jgi:hypothetical protein
MGWADWFRGLQGGKLRLGPMAPAFQAGLSHGGPTALIRRGKGEGGEMLNAKC